ncbi:cytochrome b562 [Marinobacterium sediminicola]|nr:cytochrome b562 [Marinobacterium sediminicola]ULG68629.1 cytochrome b562 [Marinobacterium sediminicola]
MTGSAHSNHCQDTQLGEQMESLKQQFKAYRQALSTTDWSQMRLAREEMLQLTHAAADEQPLKLHDLPVEQRPEMMQEYRQGLDQLTELLHQLAQAEQAQDADAASDLVGRIGQHSKQSHEALRKDCDD